MSSDSSTRLNLDEYRRLQLPHPNHLEDGHTDTVYRVHLQGDHLVTVSADKTARIWDLRTQRLLHPPLVGHTGSVVAVQFDATAHSDVIITGDSDGKIIIWRFSTGEAVKTITEAHHETVLCLHFDQKYLVTGGRDGKIKLWNRHYMDVKGTDVPAFAIKPAEGDQYQEYSLLATLEGHKAAVNALTMKDNVLVSGSGDSTIHIWSLQTGEILQKVNIHHRGVACLQYNGRLIVSGSTDNSARIYDVKQKSEVARLEGHTNAVRTIQVVSNDRAEAKAIITGSYDGSIRVWGQESGSGEWRTQHQFHFTGFEVHEGGQTDDETHRFGNRIFSIDVDANRFVCAGQGPVVRFWYFRSPGSK